MDSKCFHSLFKGLSVKEFVKTQRAKKRKQKYYEKSYESAKDLFLEQKFSKIMIDAMEKFTPNYLKTTRKFQKMYGIIVNTFSFRVHHLIQTRNELINLYVKLK